MSRTFFEIFSLDISDSRRESYFLEFWRFSRFVHADFVGCILQPEIETEDILDGERNGNKGKKICDACIVCVMYAMREWYA